MPDFSHLSDAAVTKLVGEVLQIRRDSIRDRILLFLQEELEGEDVEEDEVEEILGRQLTPGPVVDVPGFGNATAAVIAKGKEALLRQGCRKCHGPEGKGDGDVYLVDDQGNPVRPRNLVYDRLKGGNEPESICARILLGMPGSPMPSSADLDEDQLIALVHYCRSLAREPKRRLTNHQRAIEAISR
jgi:mono/diheme cytochrome c family protein